MLQEVRIQGYRCLKDVRLKLTPLHALIGPNDSGKSSILQLIDSLKKYYPTLSNQHLWPKNHHLELTTVFGNLTFSGNSSHFHQQAKLPGAPQDPSWVARQARMVHLNGSALRAPGPLLPEGAATTFSDNDGGGLASIYDVLVNHRVDAFLAIQARLRQLFPAIDRLGLVNISPTHKVMSATLKDGTRIRADEMSEGLLYYLAYAALPYLDPASVLLLEEPENGLHPARIREVMRILRE